MVKEVCYLVFALLQGIKAVTWLFLVNMFCDWLAVNTDALRKRLSEQMHVFELHFLCR